MTERDDKATGTVSNLEVDGLQDTLGRVQLQQQHDEDAVVGQLLKLGLTDLVVLQQHACDDAEYLGAEGTRRQMVARSAASSVILQYSCAVRRRPIGRQRRTYIRGADSQVSPVVQDRGKGVEHTGKDEPWPTQINAARPPVENRCLERRLGDWLNNTGNKLIQSTDSIS